MTTPTNTEGMESWEKEFDEKFAEQETGIIADCQTVKGSYPRAITFALVDKYGYLDPDFHRDVGEALDEVRKLTKLEASHTPSKS